MQQHDTQSGTKGNRIARHAARLALLATVALGTIVVGCADSASSPLAPETGSPRFAATLVATSTANVDAFLEQEKNRIALESERSKVTYDRLKLEWARLNKALPGGNRELLYCDPLQYTADVKIIGKEGGVMSIGPHKLSIPAGALSRPTVITGEMPVALNVGVKLSQHGLAFSKGVKLTLSYKHCNRPSTFSEKVVYVDDSGRVLERPASADKGADGLVEAIIWHFSGYMVSTGRQEDQQLDF